MCSFFQHLQDDEMDLYINVDKTMSADDMIKMGKNLNICPYFLGKKLISNVDLIATTFPYMINPFIRSIFLKDLQREMSELIILFDECHNLPDYAMEVSSDKLPISSVEKAIKELEAIGGKEHPSLKILRFHHRELTEKVDPYLNRQDIEEIDFEVPKPFLKELIKQMGIDPEEVIRVLKNFGRKIKKNKIEGSKKKRNISYLFRYAQFLELLFKSIDDAQYLHRFLVIKSKTGIKISHDIKCLDCRIALKPLFNARSAIFLSGTLTPLGSFMEIIGLKKEKTSKMTVSSPFSASQLLIGSVSGVDSKYKNRTPNHYQKIKNYIIKLAIATPFNTGVFVPSYAYMYSLLNTNLKAELMKKSIVLYNETRHFQGQKNDEMIQKYKSGPENGMKSVLIGVLGGRYSEGVDFPGDQMNTCVIIGVPLPKPTYHVSKLEEFYEHAFGHGKGKDYGYNLPALRKSNQAAGRPVRRLIDKGAVVFLDERYNSNYYKRFLSSWVRKKFIQLPTHPAILARKIEEFFNKT